MSSSDTFKVAIIGAGPGGALLAKLLLKIGGSSKAKLDVTVFESENAFRANNQGGSLDLNFDTGIEALKRAEIFDEFLRHARYDGQSLLLCDPNLTPLFRKKAILGDNSTNNQLARPEIDRVKLREILIESLPAGTIKWGHKLKSVYDDHTLHFHNGNTAGGFDLIVGADGAWSHVRAFLAPGPESEPIYCGYEGSCWKITDAERRAPDVAKMVNKGACIVGFSSKPLAAQALSDGSLWVYAMKPREPELPSSVFRKRKEDYAPPKTIEEIEALRKTTLESFSGYHPTLRHIVESADRYCTDVAFYRLPEGFRWASNPRITIIGDAAHLMSPFAGEGVNLALTDAMHLADTIEKILNIDSSGATAIKEQAALIQHFETEMLQRAVPAYKLALENVNDMHPLEDNTAPNTTKAKRCISRLATTELESKFPWTWWIVHPIISLILVVIYDFGLYKWLFKM